MNVSLRSDALLASYTAPHQKAASGLDRRSNTARHLGALREALGQNFVTYFPSLAKLTTSPKAALLLGHALYLTGGLYKTNPDRQGWFWKSQQEWLIATGLTPREQETARHQLRQLGLIRETRAGMPARLYYQLDLDRLGTLLAIQANKQYAGWSWEDRVMRSLMGRIVVFYAPLAWLVGSAIGGIYLSQLIGEVRTAAQSGQLAENGYQVTRRNEDWGDLVLGDRPIREARTWLQEAGILDVSRQAIAQGRLLTRLNLPVLADHITRKRTEFASLLESSNQDCWKAANYIRQKRITRAGQNAHQEQAETQNNIRQKRKSRIAETPDVYIKEVKHTNNLLQPSLLEPPEPRITESVGGGFSVQANKSSLVFPGFLLPQERDAAWQIVCDSPQAQLLLDELEGQARHKSLRNPIGYLATLCTKADRGEFLPSIAIAVQRRREAQAMETQRKNEQEHKRQAEKPESIERNQSARLEGLAKLAELKKLLSPHRSMHQLDKGATE